MSGPRKAVTHDAAAWRRMREAQLACALDRFEAELTDPQWLGAAELRAAIARFRAANVGPRLGLGLRGERR